jgi:hypothetical protein
MDNPNPYRQELKDMDSPLADMPRDMPFRLPPGYFPHTLSETLQQITDDASATDPVAEIQGLSPLLAQADRQMPFTTPTDIRIQIPPSSPLAQDLTGNPTRSGPLPPARHTPVRRLTTLRAAAAILLAGTAAILLRLQTSTQTPETPAALAETRTVPIDSLEEETLDAFLQETEGIPASESIGLEAAWPDEVGDVLLGHRSALDSSLSNLPEATLLAYALETNPELTPQR